MLGLLTVYFGNQSRKTFQIPMNDIQQLNEFRKWADQNKLYYSLSYYNE